MWATLVRIRTAHELLGTDCARMPKTVNQTARSSERKGEVHSHDWSAVTKDYGRSSGGAPARVMFVGSSARLRSGLTPELAAHAGVDVLDIACSVDDLSPLTLQRCRPDLVVVDLGPSSAATIRCVREITANCERLRVLVSGVGDAGVELLDLLEAGASGLLLNGATAEDVLRTVWVVLGGATVLPRALTVPMLTLAGKRGQRNLCDWGNAENLTRREHQVIALIADGLTNKEIASALNIATFTVKSHVHNVLQKLGVQTRAQVAGRALFAARSHTPGSGRLSETWRSTVRAASGRQSMRSSVTAAE